MITVEEYKDHLINIYRSEYDNNPEKREERKQILERHYSDEDLQRIISQTYDFIRDVLLSDTLEYGYIKMPVYDDTTDYISLNLVGGYFSDMYIIDDNGRQISEYIINRFFGNQVNLEVREEITEIEEDDVVGLYPEYFIYMQGFPQNINEIKKAFFKPINVIFLDFDGVLDTGHYMSNEDVEKRIAILADICKTHNCKVVIEAAAKGALDEEIMQGTNKWVSFLLSCFNKYGIECIGKTPTISKDGKDLWKGDEIIEYLRRHPEVEHYCIIDDDDTKNMLHWKTSDLDNVRDHLVETIHNSDEHPEEEGLLPRHKEEVGKILQKENKHKKRA